MRLKVLTVLCLFAAGVCAEERQWTLSAETWSRPRDGQSVSAMAPLPEVIERWSQDTSRRLVIRYPGGEEGQLWAHELRSWLVALGVSLQSQELIAGSQQADRIELELSR